MDASGEQQLPQAPQRPRESGSPAAEHPAVADIRAIEPASAIRVVAVAETITPLASPPQPAPASFETERVREFPEREAAPPVAAMPSGAGYAPAKPVKIEWPADLQQIESDPEKIRSAQQQAAEDQLAASRPKRIRQPLPPVIEEPLVQIETGQPAAAVTGAEQKEKETALPG